MSLNPKQKMYLRGLAHPLKPVVMVGGAGLSEAVLAEIDLTIEHHELIKVRITGDDRTARLAMTEAICQRLGTQAVQHIGHIVVLYRRAKKPALRLP